ncbi:MAG: hypothetical protein AB8E15_06765 [Bdellovibrionales bacterium]
MSFKFFHFSLFLVFFLSLSLRATSLLDQAKKELASSASESNSIIDSNTKIATVQVDSISSMKSIVNEDELVFLIQSFQPSGSILLDSSRAEKFDNLNLYGVEFRRIWFANTKWRAGLNYAFWRAERAFGSEDIDRININFLQFKVGLSQLLFSRERLQILGSLDIGSSQQIQASESGRFDQQFKSINSFYEIELMYGPFAKNWNTYLRLNHELKGSESILKTPATNVQLGIGSIW